MVEMHEMVPGKRFDRYHELGQHAFGDKLGLWIVVPQQLVVEVGVDIVYMVTGGKSLKKFHELVCPNCTPIKQTYFIIIFASAHFVLSQLPNFNSISGVSLAAAVMSLRSFACTPPRANPQVLLLLWLIVSVDRLQLLHHRLGSFGGQREAGGRGVRLQGFEYGGDRLQLLERAGERRLRLRGSQRGVRDPSHHPFHAGEAVEEADVDGRHRRLHRGGSLLLPGGFGWVLGVRQRCEGQHPYHTG
ncbi:hypothetical protein BHE74_00042493 [Ensete ventricosum]|nr:hypothetical protein BHE74_00042493 [Ensete ventricosum]RZR77457.1 hypothetical protein BHM03_00002545 [Ensete ventricosum]